MWCYLAIVYGNDDCIYIYLGMEAGEKPEVSVAKSIEAERRG